MGRPTKENKLKREKLLKYFKRDSEIYTSFEDITEQLNKEKILNYFSEQASYRYILSKFNGIRCGNNNFKDENKIYFEELYNISKLIHDYYTSLICNAQNNRKSKGLDYYIGSDINGGDMPYGVVNNYSTHFIIDEIRLIEILGEDRVKELNGNGYPHYLAHLNLTLTITEKKKLRKSIEGNHLYGIRTVIKKELGRYGKNNYDNNSFLVELDFTHPLEEIQEHIKFLYEEYQQKNLYNIFDFLNIERTPINHYDHYKTNGHKPLNVLLADKLFIYDGLGMGLNIKDVSNEIDRYTNNVKNISNDKINKKTVKSYLSFMWDFIDNKGFVGFNTSFISE